ncbi:P-loop containing nucleoside triphosphate hydrolase protein [Zopfochytrium polystomum]|nr:P-loop containing nucleoside triphosphate hydrolase protein [Zopfochytrium polystomum]
MERERAEPEEKDQNGKSSVSVTRLLVALRVRPLDEREQQEILPPVVKVLDEESIVLMDPAEDQDDVLRQDRARQRLFKFDHVFSEVKNQEDVFNGIAKVLVEYAVGGFNTAVFAYGATGAGKTHTMLGSPTEPGIIPQTLSDLFFLISSLSMQAQPGLSTTYAVSLSFLEIYNESIRDLLAFPASTAGLLELREDPKRGVTVAGATIMEAGSAEEALSAVERGNSNRTIEATGKNEGSSRSHAVLQVFIACRSFHEIGPSTERVGKLSLVDLAGSERAADTNNTGIRMIEGASINKSLLALGNCINALGDPVKKAKYVNYRDSKLTRLLKDSLGGNCRTVMIANISPAASNFEETCNTLKYATRARWIKTKLTQQPAHHIDPHDKAIFRLQSEIMQLRTRLDTPLDPSSLSVVPRSRAPSNRRLAKPQPQRPPRLPPLSRQASRETIGSVGSAFDAAHVPTSSPVFAETRDLLRELFVDHVAAVKEGRDGGKVADKIRRVTQVGLIILKSL